MADSPNKPQLPPESHYDPKKLDKIFGIIALVLLAALIGIFAKDYSRDWKKYQKEFKSLELEKARVKANAQDIILEKNEDYANLTKEIESQAKLYRQASADINHIQKQIEAAQAIVNLHTKDYQFAKAQYDALKYNYEELAHEKSPKANAVKQKLDALNDSIAKMRQQVEKDNQEVESKKQLLDEKSKTLREVEKKRAAITKKRDILQKKLERIDPEHMTVANQIADSVRDWPILELANPNYRIKQIIVKDIPEDVNFMKVQRVDRCTTCHLGIDNPDYVNAAQPYRTHPKLDFYLSKNSPHPLEEFACTTCHDGRGRGTDFVSSAHTPRDKKQQKEWELKYNWKPVAHWQKPMFPLQYTEASCFKCHQDQEVIKGAEKLNLGLNLIEKSGCFGCHDIAKYRDWPKAGPNLTSVGSKINKTWAYHWIIDPKAVKHNAWMPTYFGQSNNDDLASVSRGQQEVLSIVHYLFKNSKPFNAIENDVKGDSKNGKELVASVGCLACHQVEPKPNDKLRNREGLYREFGPNLIGLGSKTTEAWLTDWLLDPHRYHQQTKMPSMRLSKQEASDIAAYLIEDKNSIVDKPMPKVDEKIINSIAFDFLKKTDTIDNAKAKINSMDLDAKMAFVGQKLIREYGCAGCHIIPGYENEKPIGPELTEEGSKDLHRLDFGFIHIEHSKQAWFKQKLLNPRIFDEGKVLEPLERNKMPNFGFNDQEAEAITTALLGFVKDKPDPSKMANNGVKANFVTQGEKLVRQFNCQGCHIIENEGGVVRDVIKDWLVDYKGKDANDAKSMTLSYSPPNLVGEGAKVQAQWLFEFLHGPTPIRPWLSIRMPTYSYHGDQLNGLVKYFNYLDDQAFPFTDIYHPQMTKEEFAAAEKLFSKEVFGCAQCHIVGDKMPDGSPDSWAPNFALAEKRLKPEWIVKWLINPAALLPGTKMPTYYDPNDFEHAGPPDVLEGNSMKQIKALRDYLLTISNQASTTHANVEDASMSKDKQDPKADKSAE